MLVRPVGQLLRHQVLPRKLRALALLSGQKPLCELLLTVLALTQALPQWRVVILLMPRLPCRQRRGQRLP
jgi:hypothetical protein